MGSPPPQKQKKTVPKSAKTSGGSKNETREKISLNPFCQRTALTGRGKGLRIACEQISNYLTCSLSIPFLRRREI